MNMKQLQEHSKSGKISITGRPKKIFPNFNKFTQKIPLSIALTNLKYLIIHIENSSIMVLSLGKQFFIKLIRQSTGN